MAGCFPGGGVGSALLARIVFRVDGKQPGDSVKKQPHQALGSIVIFQPVTPWKLEHKGKVFNGVGEKALLAAHLTAFFASRQCPGIAIRAAMDWALEQARARRAVISGFHSPLEQSVLHLLLEAHSPVVAVLARPVAGAQLKPNWRTAITEGRMVVISSNTETQRMTGAQASLRNELVAQLAEHIVIAHASPSGGLVLQATSWLNLGLRVLML